jgi:hypothetical protein
MQMFEEPFEVHDFTSGSLFAEYKEINFVA